MIPALVLVTAAAAAAEFWRMKRRGASRDDWAIFAMAVPALGMLLYRVADCVVAMLSDSWCYLRIMPAIALFRGYRLYYPDGQGPLLGWSYGPLMPCLESPLGALPHPVAAVVAGGLLNDVVLLGPLFLLSRRLLPPSPSRTATAVLLLWAFQSLMLLCPASAFWLRGIQVDTFAIGLVALGCWTLLGADPAGPVSLGRITSSAILLAAAVFSKQNEFFTLAAPVAFMAARDGRRGALWLIGALAGAGSLGLGLCLLAVGWEALFLNMWVVPAGHPWIRPGFGTVAVVALGFLIQVSGFLVLFVLLLLGLRRDVPRPATLRDWVLGRPWVLPAAAAVLIFPISVLGRVKVGGADNSNHSVYYLLAAIALAAAELLRTDRRLPRGGIPAIAFAVALVAAVVLPSEPQPLEERARENRLSEDYRFARAHPGEVWFSANPLVTLYTDGTLYHQGYGVYDRTLAKQPPTPRQLQDHLPPRLRWVSTPGLPFWSPGGLTPRPQPDGIHSMFWYEAKSPPP
ncbi:MAG TPA: hypothetical protein VKW04_03330 [Planctomycetota bacterium]|nr:hypothetical protein [Planctomycetota bacterium]